jgi:hypothetical protein
VLSEVLVAIKEDILEFMSQHFVASIMVGIMYVVVVAVISSDIRFPQI